MCHLRKSPVPVHPRHAQMPTEPNVIFLQILQVRVVSKGGSLETDVVVEAMVFGSEGAGAYSLRQVLCSRGCGR